LDIFNTYKKSLIHFVLLLILSFSIVVTSNSLSAQEQEKYTLFVLDAQLVTSDSLLPVPDAHVISKRKLWGNISNKDGRFKMYVDPYDTLMITSIGFSTRIFILNDSVRNMDVPIAITMEKDTVLINEVVIHAYWDYEVFKQLIIEMPPLNLDQFYPDMNEDPLMYRQMGPYTIGGPIQALYNVFNRSARLQRKLIKNREEYNKIMIQMGRSKDTIPTIPEHMQAIPQTQKHYLEIPGVGHKTQ
jgi:hypothetical protein